MSLNKAMVAKAFTGCAEKKKAAARRACSAQAIASSPTVQRACPTCGSPGQPHKRPARRTLTSSPVPLAPTDATIRRVRGWPIAETSSAVTAPPRLATISADAGGACGSTVGGAKASGVGGHECVEAAGSKSAACA